MESWTLIVLVWWAFFTDSNKRLGTVILINSNYTDEKGQLIQSVKLVLFWDIVSIITFGEK